ncbi:MAG TPA: hypothetical protein VGK41_01260 [Solirubrobacterales bacterium]
MHDIPKTYRLVSAGLTLLAAALFLLAIGAHLVEGPGSTFRNLVVAAAICAIASVGVVLAGGLAAAARARARARKQQAEPVCGECGEPGCLYADKPGHPTEIQWPEQVLRELAADPAAVQEFNQLSGEGAVRLASAATLQEAWEDHQNRRLSALVEAMPVVQIPEVVSMADIGAARPLPGHRPATPRERALAVHDKVRQDRDAYWGDRAEAILEQGGTVIELYGDLLQSTAIPTEQIRTRVAGLMAEVDSYVPPLLAGPTAEPDTRALQVLSDTRVYASRHMRVMAGVVDGLLDEVSQLRGRVVGQVGMAAAAQARANEESVNADADPDKLERDLAETLTDGALLREVAARGLSTGGPEPTSGI